ncbi:MAG: MarR family transcriptional regulator [SAR202 cluster bacterium]|nr:MarR family transcriptional regulator [SAR202 cluster bacterium]
MSSWSFMTNHAGVLCFIANHPRATTKQMAATLGITERSVLRIISDLEYGGYLKRKRDGRSNRYNLNLNQLLTMPNEVEEKSVAAFVELISTK